MLKKLEVVGIPLFYPAWSVAGRSSQSLFGEVAGGGKAVLLIVIKLCGLRRKKKE